MESGRKKRTIIGALNKLGKGIMAPRSNSKALEASINSRRGFW